MLPNSTIIHEGTSSKSWMSIPYNYFYIVFYLALGVALAVYPANHITRNMAETFPFEISPRFIGQTVGALFLILSFVVWQNEPKGKTVSLAMLPGAIWACFTIVNILGNDTSAWTTAVFVAASVGALVYNSELRLKVENNESILETLIKEGLVQKTRILELETQLKDLSPKVENVQ